MDWAGTAVDFGCFAPLGAFLKMFREWNIEISYAQAREPMGMLKIDHIRTILQMADVDAKFRAAHGRAWNEEDVKAMNAAFEKHLFASLAEYTDPIPGVIDTLAALRAQGLKVGSTTVVTMHNELRDTPKTGDNSHLGLWFTLAGLSALGIAATTFVALKKKKKEDAE